MGERFIPTIVINDVNTDKRELNGRELKLPSGLLTDMVELARENGADYCMVIDGVRVCSTPEEATEAAIDALETTLRFERKEVPREKFRTAMQEKVSFTDEIQGRMQEILRDPDLANAAVDHATEILRNYYTEVAGISPEQLESDLKEKRGKVLAHLGVYQRSEQGRYNGFSRHMGPVAAMNVSEYIGSASVAKEWLEKPIESVIPTEGDVFIAK